MPSFLTVYWSVFYRVSNLTFGVEYVSKNRDRLRLVAAVLEAARTGASKTRIMYMANLSFKLLEKYLGAAMSIGFVQQVGSTYELTEKGIEFLEKYNRFSERYSKVQKTLKDLASERNMLDQLCQQCNNQPSADAN